MSIPPAIEQLARRVRQQRESQCTLLPGCHSLTDEFEFDGVDFTAVWKDGVLLEVRLHKDETTATYRRIAH